MRTIREKYLNDTDFHTLVDMMVYHIEIANYTPSEMRQAAILASIIYEEMRINPRSYILPTIEKNLEEIHKWLDTE